MLAKKNSSYSNLYLYKLFKNVCVTTINKQIFQELNTIISSALKKNKVNTNKIKIELQQYVNEINKHGNNKMNMLIEKNKEGIEYLSFFNKLFIRIHLQNYYQLKNQLLFKQVYTAIFTNASRFLYQNIYLVKIKGIHENVVAKNKYIFRTEVFNIVNRSFDNLFANYYLLEKNNENLVDINLNNSNYSVEINHKDLEKIINSDSEEAKSHSPMSTQNILNKYGGGGYNRYQQGGYRGYRSGYNRYNRYRRPYFNRYQQGGSSVPNTQQSNTIQLSNPQTVSNNPISNQMSNPISNPISNQMSNQMSNPQNVSNNPFTRFNM